jgi:hypothetical protein
MFSAIERQRQIMALLAKFLLPAVAFILTVAFGLWLSRLGKPYNSLIFTVHKLSALGTVLLTALRFLPAFRDPALQIMPILLIIVAAVCIVALFATGALMSANKLRYAITLTLHQVAPVVGLIALALATYLLRAHL